MSSRKRKTSKRNRHTGYINQFKKWVMKENDVFESSDGRTYYQRDGTFVRDFTKIVS